MHSYNKHEKVSASALQSIRLLDQVREQIWHFNYSVQTEKVYLYWACFFIRCHGRNGPMKHLRDMGAKQVKAYLTILAAARTPA